MESEASDWCMLNDDVITFGGIPLFAAADMMEMGGTEIGVDWRVRGGRGERLKGGISEGGGGDKKDFTTPHFRAKFRARKGTKGTKGDTNCRGFSCQT